jgi:hypothetical protein
MPQPGRLVGVSRSLVLAGRGLAIGAHARHYTEASAAGMRPNLT